MESKNILSFALGAVCGAAGTYFFLKSKYEKEYNDYRADLQDLYANKSGEAQTKRDEEDTRDEIVNKINTLVGAGHGNEDMTLYSEMYNDSHDKTYEVENNIMQKESMYEEDDFPSEEDSPYIISEEEYADPIPANDKIALKYFIKDGILIDELSHEVMDINASVSLRNLKVLDTGESDVLYVRNETISTDYEIVVDEDDYADKEKAYLGTF